VPVVINACITLFVLIVMILGAIAFAVYLHPKFPSTWWGVALEVVALLGLGVLAVALALATWLVLDSLLGNHYRARLAQQVELRLGWAPEQTQPVSLRHRLVDGLRDLRALAAINGALLLLHLLPGIGSVMALLLGLYFNASIIGRSYMNLPMDLRGVRRQQRLDLVREHRWETVGLGGAVLLFGFVPFLGSVLLATAAVGAVLTYRRWQFDVPEFLPRNQGEVIR
jgi:CysZ protein